MGSIVVASIFVVMLLLHLFSLKHVYSWQWACVIGGFIITPILAVWQYKKVYGTNIHAIRQSLDELREVKEG